MVKPIPDRWLDYSPIGERIAGTRFIAFKVPLRQHVNGTVEASEKRLDTDMLLQHVPNLGLIVDLTNTCRYYNPQVFEEQNVAYQKLMIPGKETPSRVLSQRFCGFVANFLEANEDNDKLIGVHCTHGVNRTGYLICYFMITHLNMLPTDAIEKFSAARGHEIERENYTVALHKLRRQDMPPTFTKFPKNERSTHREKSNTKYGFKRQRMRSCSPSVDEHRGSRLKKLRHDFSEDTLRLPSWQIEQRQYRLNKRRTHARHEQHAYQDTARYEEADAPYHQRAAQQNWRKLAQQYQKQQQPFKCRRQRNIPPPVERSRYTWRRPDPEQ